MFNMIKPSLKYTSIQITLCYKNVEFAVKIQVGRENLPLIISFTNDLLW